MNEVESLRKELCQAHVTEHGLRLEIVELLRWRELAEKTALRLAGLLSTCQPYVGTHPQVIYDDMQRLVALEEE